MKSFRQYLHQRLNEDKSSLSEYYLSSDNSPEERPEKPTLNVIHVPQLSNPDKASVATIHYPGKILKSGPGFARFPHVLVSSRIVYSPSGQAVTAYFIRTMENMKSYKNLETIEPNGMVVHEGTDPEGAKLIHPGGGSQEERKRLEGYISAHNGAPHPADRIQGPLTVAEARKRQWDNRNQD